MCGLTEKVCEALNEALGADGETMSWIINQRKVASKKLRVARVPLVLGGSGRHAALGPLGLINMVLIKAGCTCQVAGRYGRNGKVDSFYIKPHPKAGCR